MPEHQNADRRAFPAPSYARHILEPAFTFAREHLLTHMLEANKAHAVMLIEQGIVDGESGGLLLGGILQAEADGAEQYRYDPTVEDLFFLVERRILEVAGAVAGGNLQLGRSRNDLSAALCRMALRHRLLDIATCMTQLRARLADLAAEHINTLMPGVTHTQVAQPTTLGHYLLGVLGPLGRDAERLERAFRHTNRSPLGVAAFTTSSLPVDRERVAALLGFDGLIENGYDAVGAADYMLEAVAALRIVCLSLMRFINDLLIWCRSDVALATVGDEFIQISSIMPQKRNPVVLEHIRARIGYVMGDAATVDAMVHGAAFGDTVDVEDEIFVPLLRCCGRTGSILTLLSDVLATIRFDTERMSNAARAGFGSSTELAERLTLDFGIPFRQAHQTVSRMVDELVASGRDLFAISPEMLRDATMNVSHVEVDITTDKLQHILDPNEVIQRRALPGGPARSALRDALARERADQTERAEWLERERRLRTESANELDRLARRFARSSGPHAGSD